MSLCDTCERPPGQHPCARCCWAPDPNLDVDFRDQLAEHAAAGGHPLCTICVRSLPEHEGAVCDRCLHRTMETLTGILVLFDELPTHLGHLGSPNYSGDRPGASDGRPLPGGDVLALLGPGSQGLAEDAETSRDTDPTSVAFELDWWERDWREMRDEQTPDGRPRSPAAVVRHAGRYLHEHGRWAARSHPGFDDFADDMRILHRRLERATGRTRTPAKAGASCFDCGGTLVRRIDEAGFEEDVVTCEQCGARYDEQRYRMALSAAAAAASRIEVEGEPYATLTVAAAHVERSENTLKTWLRSGEIRHVSRGGLPYVSVADVEACDATRQRRQKNRRTA